MHRIRRSLAVVLCAAVTACHTWEASPSAMQQNNLKDSRIRVHTTNGARLEMTVAQLDPDSLIGRDRGNRVAVAVADIRRVDTAQFSSDRTAVAVVAGIVAALGLFALVIVASGDFLAPSY